MKKLVMVLGTLFVMNAASQETRMALAESKLTEVRNKIFIMQRDLARGFRMVAGKKASSTYAFKNFAQYQNFFSKLLNPSAKFLNDNDKKKITAAWNRLQNMYAQHLKNVLIHYRTDTGLAHLHELATEDPVKIAEGIKKILPQEPFNAIRQMLIDLDAYLKSPSAKDMSEKITSEVIENLCYMCAAFDGFSYALLTGTVKADKPDKLTEWRKWFRGLFRYDVYNVKAKQDKKAFKKANEKVVHEFLVTIEEALKLYNNHILKQLSGIPVDAYNKGTLNILTTLGKKEAQAANLYNKKLPTNYRYELHATGAVNLAGGTRVIAGVKDIDALHKKPYNIIIGEYRNLLAAAYQNAQVQTATKADPLFQEMKKFTQQHDQEVAQLKVKLTKLEQQEKTAETVAQITELKKQIKDMETPFIPAKTKKDAETKYEIIRKTLQEQYTKDRKASGIYSR